MKWHGVLAASVLIVAALALRGASSFAAAPPQTIPVLAEFPAAHAALKADAGLFNDAPGVSNAGFCRAFEPPIVVDFEADPLPGDLPAEFAGGRISLERGRYVWEGLIKVDGAGSMSLVLANIDLPDDTLLNVSPPGEGHEDSFGPDEADAGGSLWTPFVTGPACVLSITFAEGALPLGRFTLEGAQGFLAAADRGKVNEDSVLFAPAPPSNLTASASGPTQINLAWQDNSTNETGFKVQRRTAGGFKKIATIGANSASFADLGVSPGITYTYRVKSYNGSGASAPSNMATARTGVPSTFTLTGVGECNGSAPRVRLTWTASSSATAYDVYRSGALITSNLTDTSYTDAAVGLGQTFSYYVQAKNGYGTVDSNTVSATVPASCCQGPPAPTLSANASCSGNNPKVSLSWNASTGATSYDVYRNSALVVGGVTGLTYTDTAVSFGQSYSYYVYARSGSCGTNSNTVSVTVPTTCCTPPGSFTLSYTTGCNNGTTPKVDLSWSSSYGADSYDVYRNGSLLTSGLTGLSYSDSTVSFSTTYSYYVMAKSSSCSTNSNAVTATVPSSCCTPPGSFTLSYATGCNGNNPYVNLTWTTSSGASSYDVYRGGSVLVQNLTGTTYQDTGVSFSTSYSYYVTAKSGTCSVNSNTISAPVPSSCCTPPGTFTLSSATPGCNGNNPYVNLTWTNSSGAALYDVYRSGNVVAPNLTGITYQDTGVSFGGSYSYYVTAKNGSCSTNSNAVSASVPSSCCAAPGPNWDNNSHTACYNGSLNVYLGWTVNWDPKPDNGYDILRDGVTIWHVAGGNVYTDSTPLYNHNTHYVVRSLMLCGAHFDLDLYIQVGDPSSCCATPGPNWDNNSHASCISNQWNVYLGWTVNWDPKPDDGYDIFRDGVKIYHVSGGNVYTDYNRPPLTNPSYVVRSKMKCGSYFDLSLGPFAIGIVPCS